jgi:hypothetical protein
MWIMAVSQAVVAASVAAYTVLRISDELRFRRALEGVEKGAEKGLITIEKARPKQVRDRVGETRRGRAQAWINEQIGGARK